MTSFVEMMRYRYEQAPTAGRVVTVEQLLAEAERPPAPAAGDFWSKVWPGLDEREYHEAREWAADGAADMVTICLRAVNHHRRQARLLRRRVAWEDIRVLSQAELRAFEVHS